MDIRKYGKPPTKVKSAEEVLGMKKKKKVKKPKKPKKDTKKKKGKGKGKGLKSLLSKPLKKAITTDQAIYNNTQHQFLESLREKLNNSDGRTNNLWNSYQRNLTAQSFGGSPYEMYRMKEEADILRERLERTTNHGRRRPQAFSYGTQTEAQATTPPPPPPRPRQATTSPTTPPTTPPPTPPPVNNLGFGHIIPARRRPPPITPFTGSQQAIGGVEAVPNVPTNAMSLYQRQPTTRANAVARQREITFPNVEETRQDRRHIEEMDLLDFNPEFESASTRAMDEIDDDFEAELNRHIAEEEAQFQQAQQRNRRFEDVETDEFRDDFDRSQMNKAETQADRDYNEEVQRIMEEGEPMSSGTSIQESPPPSDDEYDDDDYDGWATDDGGDDGGEEEKADAYDSDTDSIQLGDMEGDMADERDAYDSDE